MAFIHLFLCCCLAVLIKLYNVFEGRDLRFRLDQELEFIMAQQRELEDMLKPLEESVSSNNIGSRQLQQADKERDLT